MASGGTFGEALDGRFVIEEFIAFITTLEVPEGDNPDDGFVFVDAVLQATRWLLTDAGGKDLAAALEDPRLEFASDAVRDATPEVVAILRR